MWVQIIWSQNLNTKHILEWENLRTISFLTETNIFLGWILLWWRWTPHLEAKPTETPIVNFYWRPETFDFDEMKSMLCVMRHVLKFISKIKRFPHLIQKDFNKIFQINSLIFLAFSFENWIQNIYLMCYLYVWAERLGHIEILWKESFRFSELQLNTTDGSCF